MYSLWSSHFIRYKQYNTKNGGKRTLCTSFDALSTQWSQKTLWYTKSTEMFGKHKLQTYKLLKHLARESIKEAEILMKIQWRTRTKFWRLTTKFVIAMVAIILL